MWCILCIVWGVCYALCNIDLYFLVVLSRYALFRSSHLLPVGVPHSSVGGVCDGRGSDCNWITVACSPQPPDSRHWGPQGELDCSCQPRRLKTSSEGKTWGQVWIRLRTSLSLTNVLLKYNWKGNSLLLFVYWCTCVFWYTGILEWTITQLHHTSVTCSFMPLHPSQNLACSGKRLEIPLQISFFN